MIGLFRRADKPTVADAAALGHTMLALPLPATCAVPAGCVGLVVDQGGRTRRLAPGARHPATEGERACCFHPGPYHADLVPFAAAPELGLRLTYAIDGPDPRVNQQRFDLYLASETDGTLGAACLAAAIEAALQRELAQGNLDLPPCTTLDEWNAFRAGFNQLLYMRFGLTVDDCLPVDLGASVDYAQLLLARAEAAAAEAASEAASAAVSEAASAEAFAAVAAAQAAFIDMAAGFAGRSGAIGATGAVDSNRATDANGAVGSNRATDANGAICAASGAQPAAHRPQPPTHADIANADAAALRRLFLELPCVMSALRMAVLPPGQALFRVHQALLQRLDLASLSATTMPALDLIAPGEPLDSVQQARRSAHAARAAEALDEAWALLARLRLADAMKLDPLFDEADRIITNLESELAARRMAIVDGEGA